MEQVLVIAVSLAILAFLVWFSIVLPYQMAGKRNRSRLGWVVLSILVSPIIAVVLLAALGPAENKADISETFA